MLGFFLEFIFTVLVENIACFCWPEHPLLRMRKKKAQPCGWAFLTNDEGFVLYLTPPGLVHYQFGGEFVAVLDDIDQVSAGGELFFYAYVPWTEVAIF